MIKFESTYIKLPELFYTILKPEPVQRPQMVLFNSTLAADLGIVEADSAQLAPIFSGNNILSGSHPLAQAYAGHQFGYFNVLGDGRAHLLGEVLDLQGNRRDVQLKGSGQTPYSRNGDGRAALGPMLREYIISEAMFALGIPTTRSLAVVSTGENIYREQVLPGAILTRVSSSHIRVGTFEYAAARAGFSELKALADYAIDRHFPELKSSSHRYLFFLERVVEKQAQLVSKWMNVGFIHGVMNTDNMTISGETIDYGPCAFMDEYDPRTVFSSIDHEGRYAYGNQPAIAHWNLTRFAEALLPILDDDVNKATQLAEKALDTFKDRFRESYYQGLRAKFGLTMPDEEDRNLFQEFFALMALTKADYTHTFYALSRKEQQTTDLFLSDSFKKWKDMWELRLKKENRSLQEVYELMQKDNPVVIPRNLFVEEALSEAVQNNNFEPVKKLIFALQSPYQETLENEKYRIVPRGHSQNYQTFCGV